MHGSKFGRHTFPDDNFFLPLHPSTLKAFASTIKKKYA